MSDYKDAPTAPWNDERDERSPNVYLFSIDGEDKTTVERAEHGWFIRDWEITDYDGTKVWFCRWGYLVPFELAEFIRNLPSIDPSASKE